MANTIFIIVTVQWPETLSCVVSLLKPLVIALRAE